MSEIQYTESQLMGRLLNYIDKKVLIEIKPIDDWNSWIFRIYTEDLMSPFCLLYQDNTEHNTYLEALNTAINYCLKENL